MNNLFNALLGDIMCEPNFYEKLVRFFLEKLTSLALSVGLQTII